MTTLAGELQTLAKANLDIAEGEGRVADQERLVTRLRAEGHNPQSAEDLLEVLRATLAGWRDHRTLILQAISRIERESGAHP